MEKGPCGTGTLPAAATFCPSLCPRNTRTTSNPTTAWPSARFWMINVSRGDGPSIASRSQAVNCGRDPTTQSSWKSPAWEKTRSAGHWNADENRLEKYKWGRDLILFWLAYLLLKSREKDCTDMSFFIQYLPHWSAKLKTTNSHVLGAGWLDQNRKWSKEASPS